MQGSSFISGHFENHGALLKHTPSHEAVRSAEVDALLLSLVCLRVCIYVYVYVRMQTNKFI